MPRIAILIFGTFCAAMAVILIKLCKIDPLALAAGRQIIAALILSPLFFRGLKVHKGKFTKEHLGRCILPGVLLGGHFVTWIIGCRLTRTVNASLIVNMVPIVLPFLLYMLVRERLNRGELIGTALALVGVAVMAVIDYHTDMENFRGDVLCFISMLFYGSYLALGRRNRDFPTVWLYLVPLYMFGGLSCLVISIAAGSSLAISSIEDFALLLTIAVVPTVLGHSLLNYSMRHFRGQIVGIVNLSEFIFAGIVAYFIWQELPAWTFYVACPLVIAGAVLALRAMPETPEARKLEEQGPPG